MKSSFIVIFLLTSTYLFSQERVSWDFSYNEETNNIEAKAVIAEGWHLYSQHIDNEIGPIPTSFTFEDNENVKLIAKVKEPQSIKEFDDNFEGELNFFKEEVVFAQLVKVYKSTEVKGFVSFMVCNDNMCLPPKDVDFTITLDKK